MDHDTLMNWTSRDSLADLPQLMSMLTLWQGALYLGSRAASHRFSCDAAQFRDHHEEALSFRVALLPLYLKYRTEMNGAVRSGKIRIKSFASSTVTRKSLIDLCRGKGVRIKYIVLL